MVAGSIVASGFVVANESALFFGTSVIFGVANGRNVATGVAVGVAVAVLAGVFVGAVVAGALVALCVGFVVTTGAFLATVIFVFNL